MTTVPVETTASPNLCESCSKIVHEVLDFDESIHLGLYSKTFGGTSLLKKKVEFSEQHGGQIQSLFDSGRRHCGMCRVISNGIAERYPSTSGDSLLVPSSRYLMSPAGILEEKLGAGFTVMIEPYMHNVKKAEDWDGIRYGFYLAGQGKPYWETIVETSWREERLDRPLGVKWPNMVTRLDSHSGSHEVQQMARNWVSNCFWNHPKCNRAPQKLPRRILAIGASVTPGWVKLQETNGEVEHYAALSYSWGKALPLKTLWSNIDGHYNGIPVTELPGTLRDAVEITSWLGIQYLWIDALCIIQDDEQDWAEQSVQMTDIFHRSSLTISAASAADCNSGIFAQSSMYGELVGCLSLPGLEHSSRNVYFDERRREFGLQDKHLSTRGWAFQEELVSYKILYFTSEGIAWKCHYASESESKLPVETQPSSKYSYRELSEIFAEDDEKHELGLPGERKKCPDDVLCRMECSELWGIFFENYKDDDDDSNYENEYKEDRSDKAFTKEEFQKAWDREEMQLSLKHYWGMALHCWHVWASMFSKRELTRIDDKLPAMAGLAKFFGTALNWNYAAGLWKEALPTDLMWERVALARGLRRHPDVAPSWSWASVTGTLQWNPINGMVTDFDLVTRKVVIEEVHLGTFGRVRNARIDAEGWIQRVAIRPYLYDEEHPKALTWVDDKAENYISEGVMPNTLVTCSLDEGPWISKPSREPMQVWALLLGLAGLGDHVSINNGVRGSYIVMLLVENESGHGDETWFRRVGLARSRHVAAGVDIFTSPTWGKLSLV